jgi:hypothetical protein
MRSTLDIEEDILFAVKEIARQKGVTCGKALSELARQSLTRRAYGGTRHGLPLFPVRLKAAVVTIKMVNQLRDKTP